MLHHAVLKMIDDLKYVLYVYVYLRSYTMYYSRDVNCEKNFGQPGDLVVNVTK